MCGGGKVESERTLVGRCIRKVSLFIRVLVRICYGMNVTT